MTKREGLIPKAPVSRIILKVGAQRVAAGAVDVFTEELTNIADAVATQAVKIAKHSGRKTDLLKSFAR